VGIFGMYRMYVSPRMTKYRKVSTDTSIKEYLLVIKKCSEFDNRGGDKIQYYVRKFYITLSEVYVKSEKLPKLVVYKQKVMKYIHNMKFRIHNDANLIHEFDTATDNINNILDNYITEAYNFHKKKYTQLI
jgi:hypothetical protein